MGHQWPSKLLTKRESTSSTMSECRCETYLSTHTDDAPGFQIVIYFCDIVVVVLCYVFVGVWTVPFHSVLSSLITICLPLILRRCIGLPLPFLLIPYHPYHQSSLALSGGVSLITLSLWLLLSCTIHQPTKQCYYMPGLCPLASVALPAQSCLQVYKLYHYST